MAQCSSRRRHRALIVEDELMIALDLEDAMSALGFDICGLASTADTARSIAMDHRPETDSAFRPHRDREPRLAGQLLL
jgi:hypothetical protein